MHCHALTGASCPLHALDALHALLLGGPEQACAFKRKPFCSPLAPGRFCWSGLKTLLNTSYTQVLSKGYKSKLKLFQPLALCCFCFAALGIELNERTMKQGAGTQRTFRK